MNELSNYKFMVSLVDIMHGIEEQASLALCIKANAINGVMPFSVVLMQPFNVSCPCHEPVVPIADKKHPATKEA
jgi:hypothetical protein